MKPAARGSEALIRRGALFDETSAVRTSPVTAHAGDGGVGAARGVTSVGRVRAHNQDCFAIGLDGRLVLVADGMGGHSSGEVASSWAVEIITDRLLEQAAAGTLLDGADLLEAIELAQRRLCRAAMYEPAFRGMATTLVLGAVVEDRLHLVHVGDARAYLWRGGVLHALTRDHSAVQQMIDNGELTPEAAANHPLQNRIVQAVGLIPNFAPTVTALDLEAGDRLLLCCDGLWSAMSEAAMADSLRDRDDLQECAHELVAGAIVGGGHDNITVVVYQHS